MAAEQKQKTKEQYVYVKDSDGVEYICKLDDLKKVDELTEQEKAKCMAPPGDA